jgi:endoglucanase
MLKNLKLRSLSFVVLILVVLTAAMSTTMSAKAINTPWLSVSGRYIKDPSNNTVILRGIAMIDIGVSTFHAGHTVINLTNDVTNSANGWYARVVRYAVYPGPIDGSPGWIANPDYYFNTYLDPAIQNCVAKQIYCIIDWHYIADYNDAGRDTATRNFWTYVAPKYANTPNVIYELYNEPIYPDNWETWKATAQPWVNIIRAAAPNNLILIGGPRWSQNLSSAASSPFVGNNLVYVAHIYAEHPQSNWDVWFGNAANSVPFFITEWGWQAGGAVPTNGTKTSFGIPFMAYLNSKGLSWTAWTYDPWWQPIMMDTNWNLLGGENYMGQFVKDELALRQNDNLPGGGGGTTPTRTNTSPPPVYTATPTSTPSVPTFTPTRTNTPSGPTFTPTRTNTPSGPTFTPTRTNTPSAPTNTPTKTPTSGGGGSTCSPVANTYTAAFDHAGPVSSVCIRFNNLPNNINSWGMTSVIIGGANYTNMWVHKTDATFISKKAADGYWYAVITAPDSNGHFRGE